MPEPKETHAPTEPTPPPRPGGGDWFASKGGARADEEAARAFIAEGEGGGTRVAGADPDALAADKRSLRERGTVVAGYKIVELIARGGMGEVYKAKRTADGKVFALKLMSGVIAHNQNLKARFLRESKAIAAIEHENTVRFIESGVAEEGGEPFLVMELVEGGTLESAIAARAGEPLELDRALDLFRQIAAGVAAAHVAGIIHRDIKPANVLVGKNGTAKVTDFGIARREHESMLLTNVGQVMGSPEFMSPEQAKGIPVDARTDVYALGALFYWLLSGRPPFLRNSTVETLQAHCAAPRPDVARLRPEVPLPIASFIQKLLSTKTDARPRDAGEVVRLFDDARRKSKDAFEEDEELEAGSEFPPGAKIGPYTIQSLLGAGGMGAVYAATHDTGRTCALKLLPRDQLKDPARVRRFLLEGELAALVAHKNIAKVEAHGRLIDDDRPFVEMELIEGTSLESMVSLAGPLAEPIIVSLALGLSRALEALAAAGIVHRDVKPANVLLAGDFLAAEDAGVKLIDFGLAIRAGAASSELDDQSLGGTPPYMSPEQIANDPAIDPLADIYSLGATLYYAATGKPPYDGATVAAVAFQQKEGPPVPVRQRQGKVSVSLGLEELIEYLLDRSRDGRFPSAAELVKELENARQTGQIKSRQVHKKYARGKIREDVWKAKLAGGAAPAPASAAPSLARPPSGQHPLPAPAAAPAKAVPITARLGKAVEAAPPAAPAQAASAPATEPAKKTPSDRVTPEPDSGSFLTPERGMQLVIGILLLLIGFALGRCGH